MQGKKCKSKPIPTELVCCEDFRRISFYQNRRKLLSNIIVYDRFVTYGLTGSGSVFFINFKGRILIYAKKDWIRNTGFWLPIYFFRMLTFLSFFNFKKMCYVRTTAQLINVAQNKNYPGDSVSLCFYLLFDI